MHHYAVLLDGPVNICEQLESRQDEFVDGVEIVVRLLEENT